MVNSELPDLDKLHTELSIITFRRVMDFVLTSVGNVTILQAVTFARILEEPGICMQDLAERLQTKGATISRNVKLLKRRGLVHTRKGQGNQYRISLCYPGRGNNEEDVKDGSDIAPIF